MPVQDTIVAPSTPSITVTLEPAHHAIHSMLLLTDMEHLSGLNEWVTQTAKAISDNLCHRLKLTLIGLHYTLTPKQSWLSFPAYLNHLANTDPMTLRNDMLAVYNSMPTLPRKNSKNGKIVLPKPEEIQAMLKDEESYLSFLRKRFTPEYMDEALEAEAYRYVVDPPAMKKLVVDTLSEVWDTYLEAEWHRVSPMLQDAVQAFQQVNVSTLDPFEAAQIITGQNLEEEKWRSTFDHYQRLVFAPSAHVGPYLGKFWTNDTLWVLFGARLPEGSKYHAPDLSRAEIVVRLNALADDTRLRILKFISEHGESSSQQIMSQLDLSQSAASRHLKQLSATGYINERRCGGAKCYTINLKRVDNTLRATAQFLGSV